MNRTTKCTGLLLVAALFSCAGDGADGDGPLLITTISRGDIVVTVRERGQVQAARATRVAAQVEGGATLIYLIPEGSVVKAGEKVAELDISAFQEKRALQAIQVAKARALLDQALKQVEVVELELEANEKTAETRLKIARIRLDKFLGRKQTTADGQPERVAGTNAEMVTRLRRLVEDDAPTAVPWIAQSGLVENVLAILETEESLRYEVGEMASQILQQVDLISLARVDVGLAQQNLLDSRILEKRGFITGKELERDEVTYNRELSNQTLSWTNLLLLVNYTLPETLIGLELEVENAGLGLKSAKGTNEATRVREKAELTSIEAEYGLAREQMANWDRQIESGILRAPAPGLVVYGRWDWDEPVYEGMQVRERQEVVILPDVSSMLVELKIPEAQIGALAEGQRASVQVDAFPNQNHVGKVTHVSTLPDPSPRSRVVKTYVTRVLIDGDNTDGNLRPGMNATVTIDLGTLKNALNVPLAAVDRREDTHFVWKATQRGPVATEVELGGNNLTHVQVLAGLEEGDRVYLVRPLGAEFPGAGEDLGGDDSPSGELGVSQSRESTGDPAAGAAPLAAPAGAQEGHP